MAQTLDTRDSAFEARFEALLGMKREASADVNDAVARIIAAVRERGDAALIDFTKEFDKVDLRDKRIAVSDEEIQAALAEVADETVEALKGSIRAANLPQGGASFVIRVPLTVAIIQALLFRVGGQDLAVPLTAVIEIARVAELRVERCGEEQIFRLREDALGLIRLDSLMGLPRGAAEPGFSIR